MSANGYLGIDAGTQGLSVTFTDEDLRVVATGEGGYDMIPGLPEGHYEQQPRDWETALYTAMAALRADLDRTRPGWKVLAIGISAQMHGEVLADADGEPLGPARLWCDARNEEEGETLTRTLGVKIPKRLTVARWLWTARNRPDLAKRTAQIFTPGGWLAHRLTGEHMVGVGDASGMFPIDPATLAFDRPRLTRFDELAPGAWAALAPRLPSVRSAGGNGGALQPGVARRLGLPADIPVAPAEGDQPAAMAGSLIADAGMVALSFGTSVCANLLSDGLFQGIHPGIDHFHAADGKPFHIAWLRNGTTFMNRIVELFADETGDRGAAFARVMPQVLAAPPDAGGLFALPFLDEEPGLGVARAGAALIGGMSHANTTPGHLARAALLATVYNLKTRVEILAEQGFPCRGMVLSGGLARTPALGQVLADVFEAPVTVLDSASEGSAWGAALLAAFRLHRAQGGDCDWPTFLRRQPRAESARFTPDGERVKAFRAGYARHVRLLRLVPELIRILTPSGV